MSGMGMFAPARRSNRKLRLALNGTAGAGKTLSAIKIARGICQRIEETEGRAATIGVIDTENGSAELYAGDYDFAVCKLGKFDPRNYVEAIKAAERMFDVLIIDSLSPAWSGEGGALSQVDEHAKRSGGNSFGAWRNVTPLHNQLVDAMIRSRCHLIATMRQKVDYAVEQDGRGKSVIRKLGLAPIQREGMDYEFDVVGDLNPAHELIIGKTRYKGFDMKIFDRPGEPIGYELACWLSDAPVDADGGFVAAAPTMTTQRPPTQVASASSPVGRPETSQSGPAPASPTVELDPALAEPRAVGLATDDQVNSVYRLFEILGMGEEKVISALSRRGVSSVESLTDTAAGEMIDKMTALAAQRKAEAEAAMADKLELTVVDPGEAETVATVTLPPPSTAVGPPAAMSTPMAVEDPADAEARMRAEEAYRRASNPGVDEGVDTMISMMGGPPVAGASPDGAGSTGPDPADADGFQIPGHTVRPAPEKPATKARKKADAPAMATAAHDNS